VAVVLAILAIAWFVRAPLPKIDGAVQVHGVSTEVIIRRDDRGIPHIAASSGNDVFFGEGYACAQDRLWQMDLLRREAEGRLSEILGNATLSVDEYFRTLGLTQVAEQSLRALDPVNRARLEAYAAGVNDAARSRELPIEFRLLGYAPDPWTPIDSVAVGLLITRSQDESSNNIMVRSDLSGTFGTQAAVALSDNQFPALEEYLPGYGGSAAQPPHAALPAGRPTISWRNAPGVESIALSEHQGSNSWSVAASRTTTGKPVLSNDTHLDHTLPSTWWLAHLSGGGFDVEGFTLPGVPGIIVGHNARIAWGVTSAAEGVVDIFIERFTSLTSDRYLANGKWVTAVHRRETIHVKGSSDVVLDVLVTRHGPIFKRDRDGGLALAWTIYRDGENLSAVTDLDRANNWREFRAALSKFTAPTLNFTYADVDGHIGYQDAGRVPLRANGDGTMPVEGQDDHYAWTGDVPFETLPHAFDSPRGFLATANNAVVPPTFRPVLSRNYLAPYRIHEIVKRLSEPGRRSPQALGSIQADTFDYPRLRLARVAAPLLAASPSEADRHLADVLQRWDGDARVDALAPSFISALERELEQRSLRSHIAADLGVRYAKEHQFLTPLVRTLEGDKALAPVGFNRATILAAIVPAAHDAEAALNYPASPLARWGDKNAAVYQHPLGVRWPLTLLNAPTVPQPGDQFAVFQSKPDFGPSMRFVADLSDWDNSSMLLTLGESGVWTDPHYDDMERDWLNVGWAPTPFTQAAVEKAAKSTLRLEPSRP
jgi:penicillin amidase